MKYMHIHSTQKIQIEQKLFMPRLKTGCAENRTNLKKQFFHSKTSSIFWKTNTPIPIITRATKRNRKGPSTKSVDNFKSKGREHRNRFWGLISSKQVTQRTLTTTSTPATAHLDCVSCNIT